MTVASGPHWRRNGKLGVRVSRDDWEDLGSPDTGSTVLLSVYGWFPHTLTQPLAVKRAYLIGDEIELELNMAESERVWSFTVTHLEILGPEAA